MWQAARQLAWDDLRFFLAVCRHQTVSAAAQQLAVDHATVSRRVARLEQALNAKLFEHQKSGYAPTLAGGRLRRMVEDVETSIITCQAEISDRNLDLEGVVRVGAPDGFGTYFLAPHLAAFCKNNPKLRINLIATTRVFSLAQREIDIAVSLAMPKEGRIFGRKLVDYDLGLFGANCYASKMPPITSAGDLKHHSFVGYIEEIVLSPLLDYLPCVSKDIVPSFRSSNLLAQLQAVREGEGIAMLPWFIAAKVGGLVPILPREVNLQRTFYLLLHEDNKSLARVRAVANYIYDQVNKEAALFSAPATWRATRPAYPQPAPAPAG
jgi:DNA-binding transcriptional LysR family regulator